jgi:hypothetical protein
MQLWMMNRDVFVDTPFSFQERSMQYLITIIITHVTQCFFTILYVPKGRHLFRDVLSLRDAEYHQNNACITSSLNIRV